MLATNNVSFLPFHPLAVCCQVGLFNLWVSVCDESRYAWNSRRSDLPRGRSHGGLLARCTEGLEILGSEGSGGLP